MRDQQDIAIIGLSGIFPEAGDLAQFYRNLLHGADSVREMPEQRRTTTGFDAQKSYIRCGYLDRIDEFDHQFFNISKREAEQMDPQQRFALELTCAAIENAGYSLREFRGSKTSVSFSALQNNYSALLSAETDGPSLIGNLTASVAGKVSYYLDLHGPAIMIDTSCSSSLVTVHDACSKLLLGEADYAFAGGLNLYIFFPEQEYFSDPLGIAAPDGKSKAFAADADGTGIGEGAGIVLLKPLEKAIQDRDNIHAVIKGSAINQDGGRSNGVAAPSPLAQTEVIIEAWRRAKVEPGDVTFIEAHGTGTYLGDPIEIQALTDAFRRYTDRCSFCAISSVKTNIGHLGFAAGISGLIKSVLALKHRKLFPSLHFNQPNPHIDFANAPLFVNTELRDWESKNGARKAAVSSFGISGTNAHLLLEEAPLPRSGSETEEDGREYLVTISAKAVATLREYARRVAQFLDETDVSLADLSFVLNAGRDDYEHRLARVVNDKRQLREALWRVANGQVARDETMAVKSNRPLIFLCSGDVKVSPDVVAVLSRQFGMFERTWNDCRRLLSPAKIPSNAEPFVFQYALSRMWQAQGVSPSHMLGSGVGNFVVAAETGRLGLEEALLKAIAFTESPAHFKSTKFKDRVDEITRDDRPVFLELGHEGILSRSLHQFYSANGGPSVLASFQSGSRAEVLETLARLYMANVSIDWQRFYQGETYRRVELPTYPFQKIRCWAGVPPSKVESPRKAAGAEETSIESRGSTLTDLLASETERTLAEIWTEILKLESLKCDDDYFDLGGNSLSAIQIVSRIEKEFGVRIEFEDIYDYSTLRQLAEHIDELRKTTAAKADSAVAVKAEIIPRVPRTRQMVLSFAQERLFHLYQLEPNSPFYNMPGAIRLEGQLHVGTLEQSLNEILKRHEILRTTYALQDGEAVQIIAASSPFVLRVIDLSSLSEEERETALLNSITQENARPFDLLRDIPFRAVLLRLAEDAHVLLLTMHHIASDGWSVGILFEELVECYGALRSGIAPRLPALAIQYVDYAYWQRQWLQGKVWKELLDYWKLQLAGGSRLLTLSYERIRPPVQTFRGSVMRFRVIADLTRAVNEFSRHEGATPFMTLLAAFSTLLYRYSGQEDIWVGSPVANRLRIETEKLIGFFANTLTLRTNMSGGPTFRQLVQRVRATTLNAYAHQDMPFEKLVQVLAPARSSAYSPLFQVAFAFQNVRLSDLTLPGLTVRWLETMNQTAKFDLTMSLAEEQDHLAGIMEYNTDLFDETLIAGMLRSFITLLESVIADPDQPLSQIPLLTEAEKNELLVSWNDHPFVDF